MKIQKHESLKAADSVLKLVKRHLADVETNERAHVQLLCFSNGREQGYCLQIFPASYGGARAIVFAQDRNGSNIVMYHGIVDEFDFTTNHPKGDNWKSQSGNIEDAAKLIADYVIAALKG